MAEQMKPSGIDGIGDIPIDWVVTPMKYLVDFYNGDRSENYPSRNEFVFDGIPFINAGHLLNGTLDFENLDYISEEKYKSMGGVKLSKDDIVYCLRGSLGKNALLNIDNGTVASSLVAIRSRNIYPKYLFYIINSHIEETQRLLWDNGTAQPNLSADNLGKFYICVPPVNDQHIIATFLDKQCNRIDGIISDLEKQIETLQKYKKSLILETVTKGLNKNVPMKPSGIDWIGDSPKHWDIKRLKYLLERSDEKMKVGPFGSMLSGADIVNEGKWVYNQRVVLDDNFNETDSFITEEKFQEMKGFIVKGGDLLITTRGTIGKVAIVPDNPPEGILHPCIIKFRVNKDLILPELVKLIFNESDIVKDQFVFMSNATTIDVIYSYSLNEIILPVIPMQEQKVIFDFLSKQCMTTDSILKDKQEQLEKIKQYKKSLIYEYVTGKKRVKEAINGN